MNVVLDIKTGKAEPWAALQTAAYALAVPHPALAFDDETHTYFYKGADLPSVTQILSAEGFIDTRFYDDWSRDRGKQIHKATHYDDLGELDEDTLDPVIVPYLQAWRKFKTESGFVSNLIETPVINTLFGYAGTPDRMGIFKHATGFTRCAVELHPDGKYKLITHTDKNDFAVWQAAVATYSWKQNNLRRK